MALWDKLRSELDRAGRAAQGALDEGRIRLDAFRARQRADKTAQAIGYALFRARQADRDIDADEYARLSRELTAHEAEAARLEDRVRELVARRRARADANMTADDVGASAPSEPPGAAGSPSSGSSPSGSPADTPDSTSGRTP